MLDTGCDLGRQEPAFVVCKDFYNRSKAVDPRYINPSIGREITQAIGNKTVFIYLHPPNDMGPVSKNNIGAGVNDGMVELLNIAAVLPIKQFIHPSNSLRGTPP